MLHVCVEAVSVHDIATLSSYLLRRLVTLRESVVSVLRVIILLTDNQFTNLECVSNTSDVVCCRKFRCSHCAVSKTAVIVICVYITWE